MSVRLKTREERRGRICALAVVFSSVAQVSTAQPIGTDLGWEHYGGSPHGLQYTALTQITPGNVRELTEAWRFRTGQLGRDSAEPFALQANPILVESRLYFPTGNAVVFALDPRTGRELWRYDPEIELTRRYAEIANRGVTSWIDSQAPPGSLCRHRIFVGTLDARLIALDGASGRPCPDFGAAGEISLNVDVRLQASESINYTVTSPPVVVNDTLVVGSAIGDNRLADSELGIVRGIDARTGAEQWRWDPIPKGDAAVTLGWNRDEAARTGSANAWAPLAADDALGLVYVPTGSASPDYYGGEREGDNRYANSLVALDARTGALVWHQQLVHHDIWDYDLPAQPTLVDLTRDGTAVPAVIQVTKMGLIFTFDRRTGEPIYEIEERPVPQNGVPGEHLSPTQPFPVAPPPLVRQEAVTPEDAWGLLLFDEWVCRRRIAALRSEGIYTPPSLEGTLMLPGYAGGMNWGGLAVDPERQIAVTNVIDGAMEVALIQRDRLAAVRESGDYADFEIGLQAGTPYAMRRAPILSPLSAPCVAPPWGMLIAVDMVRGSVLWRVPLGTIEDVAPGPVPNFRFGVPGLGGPLITATGLVFIGAAIDDYIRAFDLDTGEEIWKQRLPAGGQATPMSYYLNETGKQYIVIAAGGHSRLGSTNGDYVIAYTLPD